MTYVQIYDRKSPSSNVSDLKKKVTVAVSRAAYDVLNEAQSTANHQNRYRWATLALQNAETFGEQMMWGVLTNPTIQAAGNDSTDSDVQFVVNGLVDLFC